MRNPTTLFFSLLLVFSGLLRGAPAHADKLGNISDIVGVRPNQLVGYGVVTGLEGTGDDVSAPFAMQSLRSLLGRLGVQIDARQLRLRNVAAVIITTTIPAFARQGARIDITVSSIGNAKSLKGGILIQTPLRGADRTTYAVAQGPLLVGGVSAKGGNGSSVSSNSTNVARIPNGAIVEKEIASSISDKGVITLALREASFVVAQRVVEALAAELGGQTVRAIDGGTVEIKLTGDYKNNPVGLLAKINDLEVEPSIPARVVINERTGTVIAGGDVRLLPVAIAQGGITISVKESKSVSQPQALARGDTQVVEDSEVQIEEEAPTLTYLEGAASLADVAQALSTFGVSPRDLASILQALNTAGALRAEIVVQ